MIYGHWESAGQSGLCNNMLKIIQSKICSFTSLLQAEEGRIDLEAEPGVQAAFINIMYGKTDQRDHRHTEIHQQYIDIQLVLTGEELIYYRHADVDPVITANPKPDLYLVDTPPLTNQVHLTPGHFAVFFPGEPHQALCRINQCDTVKKAVFKIPVELYR